MLRDRPKPGSRNSAGSRRRKAPFPRILSEVSSSTLPAIRRAPGRGVEALHPTGPPAGAAVPPADRCRSRSQQGLRTCTDCSGSGFRDKLAHRIAIQAPQQWLHSGTLERHRGSPPSPGLAPKRQTLIRTGENRTGGFGFSQRSQHAGAISHSSVTRIQLTDSAVAGTPTVASRAKIDQEHLSLGKLRRSSQLHPAESQPFDRESRCRSLSASSSSAQTWLRGA